MSSTGQQSAPSSDVPTSDLPLRGRVKWFDPARGYGFVVPEAGGPDVLLHANVLHEFGLGSVGDGSGIVLEVARGERGLQAVAVLSIDRPEVAPGAGLAEFAGVDPALLAAAPLEPAQVTWFDKDKGFGFATLWGSVQDVFVHINVVRRSGFADLAPSEAVGLRVVDGRRGRMAIEVVAWDAVARRAGGSQGVS